MTLQEIHATETRSVAEILSKELYSKLEYPGVVLISNTDDSVHLYASYSSKVSQIVYDHLNNNDKPPEKHGISREEFSTYRVRIFPARAVEEAKVLKAEVVRIVGPEWQ